MAEQYIPQNVLDALPKRFGTKTVRTPRNIRGGGFDESQVLEPPPNAIPVMRKGEARRGGAQDEPTGEYYIPLDIPNYPKTDAQGYPVPPLVAKYDASGKLQTITAQTRYLADGNIAIQPEYNLSGELISNNAVNNAEGEGGGFTDFLKTGLKDFAPMIALGLGANYLPSLFSPSVSLSGAGGGAAAGGATAADIAASNALASANVAGYAGTELAAISAADVAASNALAAANTAGYKGSFASTPATGVTAGGGAITGGSIPTGGAATTGMLSGAPVTPPAAPPVGAPPVAAAGAAAGAADPSVLASIASATGIPLDTLKTFAPSVIQGLIGAGGSYLTSEQAKEAAQTQADAQIKAAQIAADAAKFRPVGVTTRFGSSNFQTDAQGNVIGAGYTPSTEITGYQDRLRTLAGQGMTDIEGARAAYQPLTGAAQSLFSLGQGYLAKTPEQAAQDYISKQQALLTPSRENQLAELRNRQFQTGRGGAATAQGGSLMNTNPEMAAYYNSLAQQDLVLAAQADEEARRRITYGAGLFDTGANLQGRFYTGQTGAYAPFTTAMDTSSGLERLAQQPLDLSTAIGQKVSTANANVGSLTGQGIINAASTMAPANAYSGTGNLLAGAANSPNVTRGLENIFGSTPNPPQSRNIYTGELIENLPPPTSFRRDPVTGQYIPVR